MTKDEWIQKLTDEGYSEIRVCPIPPNMDLPEHTHDVETVHVILTGGLTVTDQDGEQKYAAGDRADFPAGTTHIARGHTDDGTMIVGERK